MRFREKLAKRTIGAFMTWGMNIATIIHMPTVRRLIDSGALEAWCKAVWPPPVKTGGYAPCVGCGHFPQRRDGKIDHLCHLAHYVGRSDGWNAYQLGLREEKN